MNITQLPSPNFSKRNDTIKEIILHYTDSRNFDGTVAWLCDGDRPNRTSAHYVVGREGQVAQLVKESDKAWHASSHNSKSIGIENSANSTDKLTDAQEQALVTLLKDILARNNLSWQCITAHRFSEGNEGATNCPANLWPTKQDLEDWKQKHFGTPVVTPAFETLQIGSTGADVVILHKMLVEKKYLSVGNHGGVLTENTKKAVQWFQRTNGLYPDGVVGPKTWAALCGQPYVSPKTPNIFLTRTTRVLQDGLNILNLKCGTLNFNVISGQPKKQKFRLPSDPNSFPGNMEPIPQGVYEFGPQQWANGVGIFDTTNESGLAPWFLSLVATFTDDRGEFGIHFEGNIPGSAGCVVFASVSSLKKFYQWYVDNQPINLNVNWGL